jgi:lysophospholipase L1-like esterase
MRPGGMDPRLRGVDVRSVAALAMTLAALASSGAQQPARSATTYHLACGDGALPRGALRLDPAAAWDAARGVGFRAPLAGAAPGGDCASDRPFLLDLALPEGDYEVTVTLGDRARPAVTTVKAEARRLMLEKVATRAGERVTRTFTVNVRTPRIAGAGTATADSVRLKAREVGSATWDDRLTLEFNGPRAALRELRVAPARTRPVTVYLAGNSTVVDQTSEPWAAWGQMIPRFFGPGVVVANHAESGETLRAFVGERRLAKVLSGMRAGDWLFVEFAHNDQKPGPAHLDAFTGYLDEVRRWVGEARARGAHVVLVTSTQRRNFDSAGRVVNTLGDYPAAMRRAAELEKVPLVDLTAMTARFYEALGPERSKRALVHYPANSFPDQPAELKDDTHFSNYGAYEIARMVVEGLRAANVPLARFLLPGLPRFDPSRPDAPETFDLPASPLTSAAKPAGS